MSTETTKIGEILRAKREALNFSIKEVENSTSIRGSYLEAIENGLNERFLTPVYMFGFMRQYASFLGLDLKELSDNYPEIFAPSKEKHDFAYGIGTLEVRGSINGGVKWLPNLLWGALGIGMLALAWYLSKYLNVI
jgi:cytoskeletal protein RodZ